ncbi:linear amide C-N hydrolase [Planomonospora corallina]|uniref:Linear amide C-N hydrolase n=1 Tax=Planomonospora corallina TaxID=1806052 RepID=A0ABV8IGK8_9ACTN
MENPRRSLCAVLAALAVAAAGGCSASPARDAASPSSASPFASTRTGPAQGATPRPVLTQSASDIRRTIESLRRVDDLPLYEMTFHGSYDRRAPVDEELLSAQAGDWACSLFALPASGAGGPVLFGRNFDWDDHPAMIVHADPPDGHASLSVVDLHYVLGDGGTPDPADPQTRRRMAHAVLLPFDGVNDKGLAVGMAQVPDGELPARRAGRPAVGSVRIMRIVLDEAATVDEALEIMRGHDIDFSGGPQLHYMIADATGRSVVVEFARGRLNVIEDRALTNFAMTGTGPRQRMADGRYRTLVSGMPDVRDWKDAMALLARVAQGHTRWSVVYDLRDATARVVTVKRWERVHTFPLVQR